MLRYDSRSVSQLLMILRTFSVFSSYFFLVFEWRFVGERSVLVDNSMSLYFLSSRSARLVPCDLLEKYDMFDGKFDYAS